MCRKDFAFDEVIECRVCGDQLCEPCAGTEEAFHAATCQKCIPVLVENQDREIVELKRQLAATQAQATRLLGVAVETLTEIKGLEAPNDNAWHGFNRAKKRADGALDKLREMAS